jgi:hypothetical protein
LSLFCFGYTFQSLKLKRSNIKDEEVAWQEWLIGSAVAFLMAGLFHGISIWGMTADVETWSGQIVGVAHYGQWTEEYEQSHTRTVGSGKNQRTETYYTTEHTTHYEHWTVSRNFGAYEDVQRIEEGLYSQIYNKFGSIINQKDTQRTTHFGGHYDGGDRNIYITHNNTGYLYPVTVNRSFENRVKASPTLFSFAKVPTNITVYPWPENPDWMESGRLLGTASALIDQYKFDCMNTRLGPSKRVNVIVVGFGNKPQEYGQWQQAKWIGGKKNDLVLCFGGGSKTKPADWSYVFGWSESELVKKNLQSILLEHPINDALLSTVSNEISNNYIIKDWSKFDYIAIEPPAWSYWVYFLSMIAVQGGLYWGFRVNDFDKSISNRSYGVNSYRRKRSIADFLSPITRALNKISNRF